MYNIYDNLRGKFCCIYIYTLIFQNTRKNQREIYCADPARKNINLYTYINSKLIAINMCIYIYIARFFSISFVDILCICNHELISG